MVKYVFKVKETQDVFTKSTIKKINQSKALNMIQEIYMKK